MTETKAVTDFGAVVEAEERYEKSNAMDIYRDMMNRVEEERLNAERSKFQVGDGIVEMQITLVDDKEHKQSYHKEIIGDAISQILGEVGNGSRVYYETARVEVDPDNDADVLGVDDDDEVEVEVTESNTSEEDE